LRGATDSGKVCTVEVPWALPGSGFVLLFEALALALIERKMPVNRVAEILKVNPQCIWTIFNHWISKARSILATSSKVIHNYLI
jgi:transposase